MIHLLMHVNRQVPKMEKEPNVGGGRKFTEGRRFRSIQLA